MTGHKIVPDAVAPCRTDSAEPPSRLRDGKGPADGNDTDTVEGSATGATTHDVKAA